MVNIVPWDLPRHNIHHDTSSAFSNNVPLYICSIHCTKCPQHALYTLCLKRKINVRMLHWTLITHVHSCSFSANCQLQRVV